MVLMLARLPVAKLFLLGVRQAARPIAKVAMATAERSKTFQDCCARAAMFMESGRITMPRDQAVQAGCLMLGEAVVFGLTGSVLVYEYGRAKDAERQHAAAAVEAIRSEALAGREELRVTLQALEARVVQQAEELASLREAQVRARAVLRSGQAAATGGAAAS
mmetsp:Transcript_36459/g.109911  ORF Transcript_36459/g.109911 Transcript_36459/m.109911 type:complete len:163 (+) Transcript_36459:86-574(+)